MIKLERPPATENLLMALKQSATAAARFYGQIRFRRSQARFSFELPSVDSWPKPSKRSKCAYCEQYLTTKAIGHRYRPEAAAKDGRAGKEWPNHYWWVAFEWQNLMVLCPDCASLKGHIFPVAQRAAVGTPWQAMASEQPILIDPFAEDPSQHISFDLDGVALPRSARGNQTIELLALNRADLIRKRHNAVQIFRQSPHRVLPNEEFAGCLSSVQEELRIIRQKPIRPSRSRSKTISPIEKTAGSGPEPLQYIKLIEIRNFRAIRHVSLEVLQSTDQGQGWKVLLGENAAGKSTILKAISMVLMGQDRLKDLNLQPICLLRRWKTRNGAVARADDGFIRLTFLNGLENSIEFNRKSIRFRNGSQVMQGPIRAYGSMRLLPETGQGASSDSIVSSDVTNLFDPRKSLRDAENHLLHLDLNGFNSCCKALKVLLALENEKDIERTGGRVFLHLNNVPVRIDELSDGYQSMLALAVDFMSGIANIQEMEHAQGILILDELGAHLHPRWRMDFVRRLRETFRRVQVIATTHEPLCLIGLGRDEVALLQRAPDGKVELLDKDELPNPAGMRADQILTSHLFGLHSTIDPRLEAQFQRYYALLALKETELTPELLRQRDALRNKLSAYRTLGFTRRDQVMYDMIDRYLALERKAKNSVERRKLKRSTMRELRRMWIETGVPKSAS